MYRLVGILANKFAPTDLAALQSADL